MSVGTVTFRGWAHLYIGLWSITKDIPVGWVEVSEAARAEDKVLVATAASRRRAKGKFSKGETQLKGKWELVDARNVGQPAKNFMALIRKEPAT